MVQVLLGSEGSIVIDVQNSIVLSVRLVLNFLYFFLKWFLVLIVSPCLMLIVYFWFTYTWFDDTEMGDWCREYRPHMSYEECYIDAGV